MALVKPSYAPPTLTLRQHLADVTATVKKLSSDDEGGGGPICLIARAVYGDDDPRWLFFRAWLLQDAPAWLRRVYVRHEQRLAPIVARRRWLAGGLRVLMDRAISGRLVQSQASQSGAKPSPSR